MRGTLDLLPAAQIGTWIAASDNARGRSPRAGEIPRRDQSQLDALTEAIPSVLSDEPVTRRS